MKGIYFDITPLNEALRKWEEKIQAEGVKPLEGEQVMVEDSLGRVTAGAVYAVMSSPFYHSSAMDGYAVRFADTFGASEASPVRLRTGYEAVYIDTGDPVPDEFNAVIMVEDVNLTGSPGRSTMNEEDSEGGYIEIIRPATPWQHVRVVGEDIVNTELILPENHKMRPFDIGAVISGGHVEIYVRRRPKVMIIPTGSELVEPGKALKKGDIIEYNSIILASLVTEWGGEAVRVKPVPDKIERIKQAVLDGCDSADLVVVNAGSSAGSEDFTRKVMEELGELILHGVNIKPGRPVILGWINKTPVLGIPGYPVSAYITFSLFAKELVYRLQGLDTPDPVFIKAILSRQTASRLGQEEFLRVKVGKVGGKLIATPVSRGAGVLMSLVRADGFVRIPAMSEGPGAGAVVDVELIKEKKEIENTLVCIGSHDNTLDILSNILKKNHPKLSLSSAHTGSKGGLIALKRGEAHLAGTHLLDEETGEYNIPFIRRILGDAGIVLINLVYRQQGFIVAKGNPLNVSGFHDLVRKDITFINRQRGSGTRLLTDKHLKEAGISPEDIRGYDMEEYTHMGVASAVLTGIADTGVGILAAAKALGLDFIPVARERYDLAIPKEHMESRPVSALVRIIQEDREFRELVENLGGYDISDMGKILYE